MKFFSTNKQSPSVNFETALMQGLAPDGGLYFPESFPQFSPSELEKMNTSKDIITIGTMYLEKWIGDEIPHKDLQTIVSKSLDFEMPIKKVGEYHILELFHGPTLAFKDIAAKTLAQLTGYFLKKRNKQATILVATSGDTGGAVAQGFAGIENVKVVVLFPKGKVSKLQEEQLTRTADNVLTIEVDGVFDDCQRYVKQAFVDPELSGLHLTSANSINIGRLLPQAIYYFYTYAQLGSENLEFIVPSGNMGNISAGLFAKSMGAPFHSFIVATNENDPAVEYYNTGIYHPKSSIATLSNAMDIGNPSNFDRILELFHHDHEEFKKTITAVKVSDRETIETIRKVYEESNYLLDPHTAVAWTAAERLGNEHSREQVIISTASPVKFASEIQKVTGIEIDDSEEIAKLQTREKRKTVAENSYSSIKKCLLRLISS